MNSPDLSGPPGPRGWDLRRIPRSTGCDNRSREAEMIVGVVEGRRRVQVEMGQHPARPGHPRNQVGMDGGATPVLGVVGGRNRIAIACRSSPAKPRPPSCPGGSRRCRRGCPARAAAMALAEFVGKGGQRILRNAQCPQAIPGEGERDPAIGAVHRLSNLCRRTDPVQQFAQPRPARPTGCRRTGIRSARSSPACAVSRMCWILSRVKHRCAPVASLLASGRACRRNAALSLRALLDLVGRGRTGIRRTRGKLGNWCSRTNLMKRIRVGLPVLGEAFQVGEHRGNGPTCENSVIASSVYLSKVGVEKSPDTGSAGRIPRRTAPSAGSAAAVGPAGPGVARLRLGSPGRTRESRLSRPGLTLADDGKTHSTPASWGRPGPYLPRWEFEVGPQRESPSRAGMLHCCSAAGISDLPSHRFGHCHMSLENGAISPSPGSDPEEWPRCAARRARCRTWRSVPARCRTDTRMSSSARRDSPE